MRRCRHRLSSPEIIGNFESERILFRYPSIFIFQFFFSSNLGNLFLHQSCAKMACMSGLSVASVASIHRSRVSNTLSTCRAARPTWWGHWQRMKLTDCGTVNSPFPMFSKSLKMVSPSNGYSPVVKLYKVTPLKISFQLKTNSLWSTHRPRPDVYLEAWECLMAVGHLRWLESRGSLCEQTIKKLLDSEEKWFGLRWGLVWIWLLSEFLKPD